jgi:hypothetical protein
MVLLQQETIYTTSIFQNANIEIKNNECDLLFSYDGHDIYLEKDNNKIEHEQMKILEIYTQIVIPMSNNFSRMANSKGKETNFKNPYILQNGVVIEWSILKGSYTSNSFFICMFDIGVNGCKAGFKVELTLLEEENPYYIYKLFLEIFTMKSKQHHLINASTKKTLDKLIKEYKLIRKKARLEKGKIISTKQALLELINLKRQVNIVMKETLSCSSNNAKQAKLLDLRNKIMNLKSTVNFDSKEFKAIVEDPNSYLHFLLKTTIFNRRFLARELKNNFLDDWYY